jgi:hypothetical protein
VVRPILSPPQIVKLSVQSTSFVQGTLTFNNLRASAAAAPAVLKVVVGCRVGCTTALQRFTVESGITSSLVEIHGRTICRREYFKRVASRASTSIQPCAVTKVIAHGSPLMK